MDQVYQVVDGKSYNRFGQQLIDCRLCDRKTTSLGTKLCDRCWELETRITYDLKLAVKVFKNLGYSVKKEEE